MPRAGSAAGKVLTIQEIADLHEGEWVLIKILDSSGPMETPQG